MARTVGVLARVAQFGSAAAALRDAGVITPLLEAVIDTESNSDCQVAAIRMLAAMATKDSGTVATLSKSKKLFKTLPELLTRLDITTVGNACMIISQCAAEETNIKAL